MKEIVSNLNTRFPYEWWRADPSQLTLEGASQIFWKNRKLTFSIFWRVDQFSSEGEGALKS